MVLLEKVTFTRVIATTFTQPIMKFDFLSLAESASRILRWAASVYGTTGDTTRLPEICL